MRLDQVSAAAEIPDTNRHLHSHEKLFLDVTIQEEGFIYIYVSNDDEQDMDVYFDDLKVTHELSDIVAGADYYPFGLKMDGREITREDFRFGYQGQFAEEDEETGWNSFELRMYDPVIGRWMVPNPKKEFASPYLGMANNPVNLGDPDGGSVFPLGGIENPANIFKRAWNFISGNSFLNKAYNFQKQNPDIEVQYQYASNGEIIGAGALIATEFSTIDDQGCAIDCGIIQQEISFGKFDFGLFRPDEAPFSPSALGALAGSTGGKVSGWIVRKVYGKLSPNLQQKFVNALRHGLVAPTGKQGVIKLAATENLALKGYTHKLKDFG